MIGRDSMKKFSIGVFIFLLLYSIYFDLKVGTLPSSAKTIEKPFIEETSKQETTQPYQDIAVNPGETVLTIIERLHDGQLPVSIEKVVVDFETLNPDTSAHAIQANTTYHFPVYR